MQLIFSILWIFKIACPLEIFKLDWWKGTCRCNPMYAKHYFFKFQNKKKSNALTLTHLSAHWCDSFIFSDKLQQINFLKSYNVRMNLHSTKFFLKVWNTHTCQKIIFWKVSLKSLYIVIRSGQRFHADWPDKIKSFSLQFLLR